MLCCVNHAALPLARCYSIRLPRRVASWVDYSRHKMSRAHCALRQWSHLAEGWCTMVRKWAVLRIEPTTCGSESECATHYTTAPHKCIGAYKMLDAWDTQVRGTSVFYRCVINYCKIHERITIPVNWQHFQTLRRPRSTVFVGDISHSVHGHRPRNLEVECIYLKPHQACHTEA
jgi:hypothetical protein